VNRELPRKKCVLVVDDEPRIGKILGVNLGLFGYDTLTVTSGAEALKVVETRQPDVMLLDIVMPVMDGFEVLSKLRTFSKLPVIAFSARAENGPRALELGANDFVNKPFDIDDLIRKARKMLGDIDS
jgi:two-component system KDP operon response regulator KdpE